MRKDQIRTDTSGRWGEARVRKKIVAFLTSALLVVVVAFALGVLLQVVNPLQLLGNPAPKVIPSLREWQGGSGLFVLLPSSRILVDPSAAPLSDTAQEFQGDLAEITGRTLPVVSGGAPAIGDFALTLGAADPGIGDEGYLFKVGTAAVISANTPTGVFYGTRTALQILLQDPTKSSIPKGTARDYPKYRERGFMLDVGRKFFSLSFLEDYVRFMSWYKMNDFHLHFNDNEINAGNNPDWMHRYAAFRLNSDKFKNLAAKDGSYTKQDMRELQDIARQHAVTITPEIDMPAHALALTQFRPDLASPKYSKEFLDLSNPNTYPFVNSLWDEFTPWFDSPQMHIGADEYSGADADNYRRFINTYDGYLKSKGKTVRIWGSLAQMPGSVAVNSDMVMDLWDNDWANAVDTARQGFDVINMNDNLLYIVPKAGYFQDYLDTKLLYQKWEPNIFDLSNRSLNLQSNDPHLLGGMFAEWNDRYTIISEADVHARVEPAMETLGEKMWSGTTSGTSYDDFKQLAAKMGDGPGTHLPGSSTASATTSKLVKTTWRGPL
jgi:hexosaminidase